MNDIAFIDIQRSALFAIVDADKFQSLLPYDWFIESKGYIYRYDKQTKETIYIHRQLMPDTFMIDHKNRLKFDNRICNLRDSNHMQNAANSRKIKNEYTTSEYKGVSFDYARKKFAAKISYKGKTLNLGRFDDEIEAAKVRDSKAKELFGEFANLNFP